MKITKCLTSLGVCFGLVVASCAVGAAQDAGAPPPKQHGFSNTDRGQRLGRPFPGDPTFSFVGSEMHFGGATVKGAPYSAIAVTENVQTLKNGTNITRKDSASVYRDGEGRTRIEQTLKNIGPFAASDGGRQMTFIQDPVAGVHYVLDVQNKTVQKMRARGAREPRPAREPHHQLSSSSAKTESLGTQMIEGVQAEGTRSTLTIPAGQIGNDQPIDIVSERWYSPELQVVVLSKHSDPRMGEHVYRLTNINRAEPAHALFEAPSDYTTVEPSPGRRPGPGPRGTRPPSDN